MLNKSTLRTLLFTIIACFCFNQSVLFSQNRSDSLFNALVSTLETYSRDTYGGKKDSLIIFLNVKQNILKETFNTGGKYYSIVGRSPHDKNLLDTSSSNRVTIFKNFHFDLLLNYLIDADNRDKPTISNLKGTWIYVTVPDEAWQHFYLDSLLGYKTLYINAEIDFFEFDSGFVNHKRLGVKCKLETSYNFSIENTTIIRKSRILVIK